MFGGQIYLKTMGKTTPPTAAPANSSQYRFFCWVIAFLTAAQLLVGLDYITLWPGAEARLVWAAVRADWAGSYPVAFLSTIPAASDYWLLAYRLPGVLLLGVGVVLFFRWGTALFGRPAVETTLLVAAASLFIPLVAKAATLDIWRLGLELAAWVALLRYFKTPTRPWLLWSALMGGLAVVLVGRASLVLFIIFQVLYYRMLVNEDANLKRQFGKPFVLIYLAAAVAHLVRYLLGAGAGSAFLAFDFMGLGHLRFVGYSLLGLLPFVGFMVAALRDLFYKLKRGEELAQLLAVALLAAVLTQSLLFPFLLAFITAKQVQHYFQQKNYPWQDWVKATQVLHLVLVFVGAIVALVSGFIQYQADGFRMVLGCGAAYWMFSFLGVVGLYGFRRDYVLGGMTLAGVLTLLFFWVQVYPYLHLQRNWPERLAAKIPAATDVITLAEDDPSVLPLAPYLHRAGRDVRLGTAPATSIFVARLPMTDSIPAASLQVLGRSYPWEVGLWGVAE